MAPVVLLLAVRAASGRAWSLPAAAFFALGLAVPLAVLAAYNAICFGSPWVLSSAREAYPAYSRLAGTGLFGFGPPDAKIAAAYLFHPARGLVLFSPFLLWAIPGFLRWWRSREDRADCVLALGATLVYFVLMTGYPNWHGGWSLGNRYLLPVVFFPALALCRALRSPLSRGLFAAAVVLSVGAHFLLTASWPYFPDNVPWPAATGSVWFLERGWVAPSLLQTVPGGAWIALALAAAAVAAALIVALRGAVADAPAPGAGGAGGTASAPGAGGLAAAARLRRAALASRDLRRLLGARSRASGAARGRRIRVDPAGAAHGDGCLAGVRAEVRRSRGSRGSRGRRSREESGGEPC